MTKPKTKFNYKRYLASREWAVRKQAVMARASAGTYCERCCNQTEEQLVEAVHHLTYERIGQEELEDLQAVCGPCHEFLSGISDLDPVSLYIRTTSERLADAAAGLLGEAADLESRAQKAQDLAERNANLLKLWELTTPRPPSYRAWLDDIIEKASARR